MRALGQWLLARPRNGGLLIFCMAVLSTFSTLFGVLFGWIGGAALALITLVKGPRAGVRMLLLAAIPGILLSSAWLIYQLPLPQKSLLFWGVVWHDILAGAVAVVVAAIVLARTQSWALVMQALVLLAIVVVAILHGFMGDMSGWWQEHFNAYFAYLQQMADGAQLSADEQEEINTFLAMVRRPGVMMSAARVFTGLSAAFLLLGDLFKLVLGRGWQAYLYHPGGLAEELVQVRMGYGFTAIALLCFVGMMMDSALAWDILPLVVLPLVLAGLSLVHAVIPKVSWRWVLVLSFYILFLWQTVAMAVALMMVSLLDVFINFRKRLPRQS